MSPAEEAATLKLSEENWFVWSTKTKAKLKGKECWGAVSPGFLTAAGELKKMENLTAAETKSNEKAVSILMQSVEDQYIEEIGDFEYAKEIWDTLEAIHNDCGVLRFVELLDDIGSFKKTKDMSMMSYLSTISGYNRKLLKFGVNLDDQYLAGLYLAGLPGSMYRELTRTIQMDEGALKSTTVKAKLLLEEKRIRKDESKEAAEEEARAMVVKKKYSQRDKSSSFLPGMKAVPIGVPGMRAVPIGVPAMGIPRKSTSASIVVKWVM